MLCWSPLLLFGGLCLGEAGWAEGALGFGRALYAPGEVCDWKGRKGAVALIPVLGWGWCHPLAFSILPLVAWFVRLMLEGFGRG